MLTPKTIATILPRVAETRCTNPALGHALIEPDSSGIRLTVTDLEQVFTATVPGSIAGPMLIPLAPIVAALKAGRVDIELMPDGRARIGSSIVPTLPVSDFPELPTMPPASTDAITTGASEICRALASVLPAVSTDDARTGLNAAAWGATGNGGWIASTDGHRLMVTASAPPPRRTILVARVALRIAGQLADATTTIAVSDIHIRLSGPGWSLTSRLVDGEFPDWHMVLLSGWAHRVRMGTDVFARVATAAKQLGGKPGLARVTINGKADFSVIGEGGRWSESADCEHEGPDNGDGGTRIALVGLNARYMADAMDFVGGAEVEFTLGDKWTKRAKNEVDPGHDSQLAPVMIAGAIPGRLAIVMPMRLE